MQNPLFLPLTVLAAGLIGWHAIQRGQEAHDWPALDAGALERVLLHGCVISPPAFYENRDQFVVELSPGANARVTLTLREGERALSLRYGDTVEIEARVRPIRNFQNPEGFDYRAYSARSGVYWTASVLSAGSVHRLPERCGSVFTAAIFGLRTAALERIDRLYSGSSYATAMMEAILLGESTKLDRLWTENFRRTGTYHMLVISGLHITVIAGVLLFVLRLCFVPEMAALFVTASTAWLYALVSGSGAPVVRGAGGFTLYLIARFFYRRGRLLNLLSAIAILYLAYDRRALFDASFLMSFLSVAAIGAFAVPLLERTSGAYSAALRLIGEISRDPRLEPLTAQFRVELRLIAETMHEVLRAPQPWCLNVLAILLRAFFFCYELALISAVIQVSLALPMALFFHRISITGVAANILIVPLLGPVVPLGFLAVLTNWSLAARLASQLLTIAEAAAARFAAWEPSWRVPDPPLLLSIAFIAALLLSAWAIRRSKVTAWVASTPAAALFCLVLWHPFAPAIHARQLELSVIDVGQGDSLLLAFPTGKLMLIDGGGVLSFGRVKPRLDIGEDVVSPYLWSRGIRHLDVVALTHAHDDHAGGLPAVIENFHPAELWTGFTPASDAWSAVAAKARAEHAVIRPLRSGTTFDYGGAIIDVLSPPTDYVLGNEPKNNDSLVLRVSFGRRSFLLTGDMEKPMELRLLGSGEPLHADVLKVAHHGSNTSSVQPFVDAVAPNLALISDGFENSFRHPHRPVLERLAREHASILRTDLDGLITVRTDGDRICVETFRSRGEASTALRSTLRSVRKLLSTY